MVESTESLSGFSVSQQSFYPEANGSYGSFRKNENADCWVEQPRGFRSENSSSASKSSELSTLICFFGVSKYEKMFLRKPDS